jgi:hypothetical protein
LERDRGPINRVERTITVQSRGGYVNATYKTQCLVTVTTSLSDAQGERFQITFASRGTTFQNKMEKTPYRVWVDADITVTVSNPQQKVDQYESQSHNLSNSLYIDEPKTIILVYA